MLNLIMLKFRQVNKLRANFNGIGLEGFCPVSRRRPFELISDIVTKEISSGICQVHFPCAARVKTVLDKLC